MLSHCFISTNKSFHLIPIEMKMKYVELIDKAMRFNFIQSHKFIDTFSLRFSVSFDWDGFLLLPFPLLDDDIFHVANEIQSNYATRIKMTIYFLMWNILQFSWFE